MTKNELNDKLIKLDINPNSYKLDGGLWDDRYILNQESGGKWSVYYSERGEMIGYTIFDNENDACSYVLKKIENDPSTRNRK
ncbi:MAG: hypothetical protein WC156_15260 [Pedobacter sp.]